MTFLLAPLTVAFLQVELPVAFLLASLAVCLPSHNTQLEFVDTSISGGHSGVQLCSHTTQLWNNMESLATCTLFPGTLAHNEGFVCHRHKAGRLVSHAEPHLVQYLGHPLVPHSVPTMVAGWCWLVLAGGCFLAFKTSFSESATESCSCGNLPSTSRCRSLSAVSVLCSASTCVAFAVAESATASACAEACSAVGCADAGSADAPTTTAVDVALVGACLVVAGGWCWPVPIAGRTDAVRSSTLLELW